MWNIAIVEVAYSLSSMGMVDFHTNLASSIIEGLITTTKRESGLKLGVVYPPSYNRSYVILPTRGWGEVTIKRGLMIKVKIVYPLGGGEYF